VRTSELRERFATSAVARLATVRPDGAPHVVPVVFAAAGDTIWLAVDAKPKRTTQLQRLTNLHSEPRCALLADHYDEDWNRLWWVRADGVGVVNVERWSGWSST
jgi:PPOX class probable F420-dependent enzyme